MATYEDKPMQECAVKYALDILNGKWKLFIIWELSRQNVIRFNELRRKLHGISNIMLSKSLQELETQRIVKRIQYNEIPPRVEYMLTERGKALQPALDLLEKWSNEYKNELPTPAPAMN